MSTESCAEFHAKGSQGIKGAEQEKGDPNTQWGDSYREGTGDQLRQSSHWLLKFNQFRAVSVTRGRGQTPWAPVSQAARCTLQRPLPSIPRSNTCANTRRRDGLVSAGTLSWVQFST